MICDEMTAYDNLMMGPDRKEARPRTEEIRRSDDIREACLGM